MKKVTICLKNSFLIFITIMVASFLGGNRQVYAQNIPNDQVAAILISGQLGKHGK